jgi:putative thiamine transport system permease protein
MRTPSRFLRFAPALTMLVFLAPILAGLTATVLPAFGIHPALSEERFGLYPAIHFFSLPGMETSLLLTLRTGLTATLLTIALSTLICASFSHTRFFRRLQSLLSPLLATPHSAMAIGFAFLLAPSGWIMRIASTPLGLSRPPNIITIQDEWGLTFIVAMLLKTVPYLTLMTMAALGQVRAEPTLAVARTMGYGPVCAWMKTIFPRVYPQIRLPLYAVLAFSLSVVDTALITAPHTPPPLSVYILRLFNDKDLAMQLPGAFGALFLFGLVVAAVLFWRGAEIVLTRSLRSMLGNGDRGGSGLRTRGMGAGILGTLGLLSFGSLTVLGVWSLAMRWRFPGALPQKWSTALWERSLDAVLQPAWTTMSVGAASVLIALVLVLLCLENEDRNKTRFSSRSLLLLYVPLLVPQIAFLFGTQVLLIRLGLSGTWLGLVWCHLLFVLPYIFLSLGDPWRGLDTGFCRTASCLGASPWRVFFRIKLPMLCRPLLLTCAVGFSVSAGEYLPTLFAGAGRFSTLTTEAVTLASGGDRRIAAVYAFLQALLPLLVFFFALIMPALLFRKRADMR